MGQDEGFLLDNRQAEEIDGHLAAVEAGRLDLANSPMISAWGRTPAGDGSHLLV
ncbi:hypothetical protein [Streptomyces sp. NPDC046832]|uniref:hypothetical protein n=1 Tax=Streptomyces sp. NPDC046832 TaxID=3155020 RepID=UPI0033D8ABF0